MNLFNKFLAATFLSAPMLFAGSLQAMEIRQFDKMADQDQADYITVLVRGAEKVLNDEGRRDSPDLKPDVYAPSATFGRRKP